MLGLDQIFEHVRNHQVKYFLAYSLDTQFHLSEDGQGRVRFLRHKILPVILKLIIVTYVCEEFF